MKTKSSRKVLFSFLAVPWLLSAAEHTLAVTDLGTSADRGIQAVRINDLGQKPSFLSNALLVKLTPQARANLEVTAEEVNPAATGLPSLDLICREHAVKSFRSIVTAGAHR